MEVLQNHVAGADGDITIINGQGEDLVFPAASIATTAEDAVETSGDVLVAPQDFRSASQGLYTGDEFGFATDATKLPAISPRADGTPRVTTTLTSTFSATPNAPTNPSLDASVSGNSISPAFAYSSAVILRATKPRVDSESRSSVKSDENATALAQIVAGTKVGSHDIEAPGPSVDSPSVTAAPADVLDVMIVAQTLEVAVSTVPSPMLTFVSTSLPSVEQLHELDDCSMRNDASSLVTAMASTEVVRMLETDNDMRTGTAMSDISLSGRIKLPAALEVAISPHVVEPASHVDVDTPPVTQMHVNGMSKIDGTSPLHVGRKLTMLAVSPRGTAGADTVTVGTAGVNNLTTVDIRMCPDASVPSVATEHLTPDTRSRGNISILKRVTSGNSGSLSSIPRPASSSGGRVSSPAMARLFESATSHDRSHFTLTSEKAQGRNMLECSEHTDIRSKLHVVLASESPPVNQELCDVGKSLVSVNDLNEQQTGVCVGKNRSPSIIDSPSIVHGASPKRTLSNVAQLYARPPTPMRARHSVSHSEIAGSGTPSATAQPSYATPADNILGATDMRTSMAFSTHSTAALVTQRLLEGAGDRELHLNASDVENACDGAGDDVNDSALDIILPWNAHGHGPAIDAGALATDPSGNSASRPLLQGEQQNQYINSPVSRQTSMMPRSPAGARCGNTAEAISPRKRSLIITAGNLAQETPSSPQLPVMASAVAHLNDASHADADGLTDSVVAFLRTHDRPIRASFASVQAMAAATGCMPPFPWPRESVSCSSFVAILNRVGAQHGWGAGLGSLLPLWTVGTAIDNRSGEHFITWTVYKRIVAQLESSLMSGAALPPPPRTATVDIMAPRGSDVQWHVLNDAASTHHPSRSQLSAMNKDATSSESATSSLHPPVGVYSSMLHPLSHTTNNSGRLQSPPHAEVAHHVVNYDVLRGNNPLQMQHNTLSVSGDSSCSGAAHEQRNEFDRSRHRRPSAVILHDAAGTLASEFMHLHEAAPNNDSGSEPPLHRYRDGCAADSSEQALRYDRDREPHAPTYNDNVREVDTGKRGPRSELHAHERRDDAPLNGRREPQEEASQNPASLELVLRRYARSLHALFLHYAFSQRKVGRDPTFDSMALRSPCVNRGEFGRAARDLGLIGKLLTRGDVDMLFSELVRIRGSPLLDEAAFIEGLSRAVVFMLSRPPLAKSYPTEADRIQAVFGRVGLGSVVDLAARLRAPEFNFRSFSSAVVGLSVADFPGPGIGDDKQTQPAAALVPAKRSTSRTRGPVMPRNTTTDSTPRIASTIRRSSVRILPSLVSVPPSQMQHDSVPNLMFGRDLHAQKSRATSFPYVLKQTQQRGEHMTREQRGQHGGDDLMSSGGEGTGSQHYDRDRFSIDDAHGAKEGGRNIRALGSVDLDATGMLCSHYGQVDRDSTNARVRKSHVASKELQNAHGRFTPLTDVAMLPRLTRIVPANDVTLQSPPAALYQPRGYQQQPQHAQNGGYQQRQLLQSRYAENLPPHASPNHIDGGVLDQPRSQRGGGNSIATTASDASRIDAHEEERIRGRLTQDGNSVSAHDEVLGLREKTHPVLRDATRW